MRGGVKTSPYYSEPYFFNVSTTVAFTVSVTAFVVSGATTAVESVAFAVDSVEPDPHEANPIARIAKAMI